ncbi:MAG: MazG nucleotide pyrophosphohydrolase domain-containing protein [Clostridium sp.]|uniref:MazG nucleotide pyrophosphohydrolase domain-containing protein n=1 Tax=Clostridium sp. TaxID=1506 RepID=UPI00290AAAA7|nr:MazG nucleotide pyrophosphohydrolase domain-containing protein [Clostridium sp.]MDU7948734.1 MazG nucleotide pyrophosphohydrolase domain-containing protein [Clostridium sp.]
MKLKLMVLDENIETHENNRCDSYEEVSKKLKEEYKELQEAIKEEEDVQIAEEVFDLIQVCIRILVILSKRGFSLMQLNNRHNKKLVNRGWKHKNIINIFYK